MVSTGDAEYGLWARRGHSAYCISCDLVVWCPNRSPELAYPSDGGDDTGKCVECDEYWAEEDPPALLGVKGTGRDG